MAVFHMNFSEKIHFRKETVFLQNAGEEQSIIFLLYVTE